MEVWLNGKSLYTFDTKIDFAGLLSVRAFVIVSGLTVPEPGKMVTSFRLENKEHATYVMHMHAAPGARKA
jgi:hypothetical protein